MLVACRVRFDSFLRCLCVHLHCAISLLHFAVSVITVGVAWCSCMCSCHHTKKINLPHSLLHKCYDLSFEAVQVLRTPLSFTVNAGK